MDINALILREEGYDVEFKESVSALKPEDLVAFANSKSGGKIVIGVRDSEDATGKQIGILVGTKISDETKLSIYSKAQSCTPSINIEISTLKTDGKEIYVIDIPSGESKPYCTNSGIYKIRGDGQNQALYPNKLLTLFMESERNKFVENFKQSTKELEELMKDTKNSILDETASMLKKVKELDANLAHSFKDVLDTAEQAESNTNNIESSVDNISADLDKIFQLLSYVLYLIPRIDLRIVNQIQKDNLDLNDEKLYEGYVNEMVLHYYEWFTKMYKKSGLKFIHSQATIIKMLFPSYNLADIENILKQIVNKDSKNTIVLGDNIR